MRQIAIERIKANYLWENIIDEYCKFFYAIEQCKIRTKYNNTKKRI